MLPEQIDLDIFTKKRESKFNKDAIEGDGSSNSVSNEDMDQSSRASVLEHSQRKLVANKNNKKAPAIQREIAVAAKLNSLVRQSQDADEQKTKQKK